MATPLTGEGRGGARGGGAGPVSGSWGGGSGNAVGIGAAGRAVYLCEKRVRV